VIRQTARTALVLLATNYLDEAERCDRILYLSGGQLLIEGTPTEIRRLADVKVFRVRSSRRYGNGLVSALSRVEGVKRVETGGDSARFHAIVERDDIEARISQLGLDATVEEVDPDLETALLSLESRRRKIVRDKKAP
jgi:ABC-type multidrug transport system ATPase subunit